MGRQHDRPPSRGLAEGYRRFRRSTEPTDEELDRLAERLEAAPLRARTSRPWVAIGGAALVAGTATLALRLGPPVDRFRGASPVAVRWLDLEGLEQWELEPAAAALEAAARTCELPPGGARLAVSPDGTIVPDDGPEADCLERALPATPSVRRASEGTVRRFRLAPVPPSP